MSSAVIPLTSFDCALILHGQQQQTTDRHGIETIGHIAVMCRFMNKGVGRVRIRVNLSTVQTNHMFTSITDRKSFGATYESAVLSVLPMDSDKTRHGLRCTEVNQALGMPKEARTTLTLLLKRMAGQGIVERYEYKVGGRKFITYKRLAPLRKRERLARMIWGV